MSLKNTPEFYFGSNTKKKRKKQLYGSSSLRKMVKKKNFGDKPFYLFFRKISSSTIDVDKISIQMTRIWNEEIVVMNQKIAGGHTYINMNKYSPISFQINFIFFSQKKNSYITQSVWIVETMIDGNFCFLSKLWHFNCDNKTRTNNNLFIRFCYSKYNHNK